jgi:O-antigen/teichoic acid export membrane protein
MLPAIRFSYGFALAAMLSKYLPVEDYGRWSLFVSNAYLVLTFASVNLMYAASVVLTGKTFDEQKQDIFSLIIAKYGLTAVVFAAFATYLIQSRTFEVTVVALLGLVLVAMTANNTIFGLLRALLRVKRQVLFFGVECGSVVVCVLTATWLLGGDVRDALLAFLIAQTIAAAAGTYLLRQYLGWERFDWKVVRRYLAIGLPLIPFAFSDLIVNSLVPLLIKIYDTFESVAVYSIAQKVALLATVPNAIINNVYAQYLKRARLESGLKGVKRTFLTFLTLYLGLTAPVLLALGLFGRRIIVIVSTEQYLDSYGLMLMLAVTNVIIMITAMLTTVFAVYERTRAVGLVWLGVLAVYLVLNQLLVPMYKLDGIAYALLATFTLGLAAVLTLAIRMYLHRRKTAETRVQAPPHDVHHPIG